MKFLGWSEIYVGDDIAGYTSGGEKSANVWYLPAKNPGDHDYDGIGMNHVGIQVAEKKDVDAVVDYIKEKNITPLFDTPRHRPEFAHGEDKTYFQVMFESPDKILFEIMYTGPKK